MSAQAAGNGAEVAALVATDLLSSEEVHRPSLEAGLALPAATKRTVLCAALQDSFPSEAFSARKQARKRRSCRQEKVIDSAASADGSVSEGGSEEKATSHGFCDHQYPVSCGLGNYRHCQLAFGFGNGNGLAASMVTDWVSGGHGNSDIFSTQAEYDAISSTGWDFATNGTATMSGDDDHRSSSMSLRRARATMMTRSLRRNDTRCWSTTSSHTTNNDFLVEAWSLVGVSIDYCFCACHCCCYCCRAYR